MAAAPMEPGRLEELRQIAGGIHAPKSLWMDELIDEVDRLNLQIRDLKLQVEVENENADQWKRDLEESNRLLGEAHELLRAYMTRFWGDYAGHCSGCKELPCWTDHLLERTGSQKRIDLPQTGGCICDDGPARNIKCPVHEGGHSLKRNDENTGKAVNGCKCPCHAEIIAEGSGWPCGVDECAPCHVKLPWMR